MFVLPGLVGVDARQAHCSEQLLEQVEIDSGDLGDLPRRVGRALAGEHALDREQSEPVLLTASLSSSRPTPSAASSRSRPRRASRSDPSSPWSRPSASKSIPEPSFIAGPFFPSGPADAAT